jgi:hypothetical protein
MNLDSVIIFLFGRAVSYKAFAFQDFATIASGCVTNLYREAVDDIFKILLAYSKSCFESRENNLPKIKIDSAYSSAEPALAQHVDDVEMIFEETHRQSVVPLKVKGSDKSHCHDFLLYSSYVDYRQHNQVSSEDRGRRNK